MTFIRRIGIAVALLVAPIGCFADKPPAFLLECRVIDQITEGAGETHAFHVLRKIALEELETITQEDELRVGLTAGKLQSKAYSSSVVREHAFRKIGSMKSDAVLVFLQNLNTSDIRNDSSLRISWAAQIALQNVLLNRIHTSQDQNLFLEKLIENPRKASPAVRNWAVNLLCDRGSAISKGVLRAAIMHMAPGPDGEQQVQFCEARIHVVNSHSDRVKALGSALTPGKDGELDAGLVQWAMYQLAAIRSEEAYAQLLRFSEQLQQAPSTIRTADWRDGVLRQELQRILSSPQSKRNWK